MRRVLKFIFFASLIIYGVFSFRKPLLPPRTEILDAVLQNEPRQDVVAVEPSTVTIKDYTYTLTPRYSYELYGLVVSLYDADNWLDYTHKNDPGNIKDICVVWGENIKNGSYKQVKFSSGEFTCFWRWPGVAPPFQNNSGSNNHLIPAAPQLAEVIKDVRIGDQIRLAGYLADYAVHSSQGKKLYTRATSTSRDDAGNGACETVYVTDIEILKKGNQAFYATRRIAFWGALGSFLLLTYMVLLMPRRPKTMSDSSL